MYYTIHNKLNGSNLIHPKVGLWNTSDLNEARDMLASCKEYLVATGLSDLQGDFVIINLDTQEEIM